MRSTLSLGVALCLIFLASCTTKHSMQDTQHSTKLIPNKGIYVVFPDDGMFKGKTYAGSGKHTVTAIVQALGKYTNSVYTSPQGQQTYDAFISAQEKGMIYLIVPTILHWEPRAAAHSGIAPEAKIAISVYLASTKEKLIDKQLDIKGRSWTFASQHIHLLVAEFLPGVIDSLYN